MTTQTLRDRFQTIFPGLAVTALVAVTAAFLSEHYGAPAMLMAILLGIALHFLSEEGRTAPGVDFAAKVVLRFGVALLGLRISAGLVADLGFVVDRPAGDRHGEPKQIYSNLVHRSAHLFHRTAFVRARIERCRKCRWPVGRHRLRRRIG